MTLSHGAPQDLAGPGNDRPLMHTAEDERPGLAQGSGSAATALLPSRHPGCVRRIGCAGELVSAQPSGEGCG